MKTKIITQRDILLLAFSFFIVVFAWIGFNLYHIWATSTISEDLQKQVKPISGTFDTQTINELKNRQQVEPVFTTTNIATISSSKENEITATESSNTKQATTEGSIITTGQEL